MTTTPEFLILSAAMAVVGALCGLGVVCIDLWTAHRERHGRDGTAAKSARRLLLILSGVCFAIALYHLVLRR